MTISADEHRPFGKTGLSGPPIVFCGGVLDNAARVISDRTKRLICGEWFQRVAPPVFVDVGCNSSGGAALQFLGRTLSRLDVAPGDVVINFSISLRSLNDLQKSRNSEAIRIRCDEASELLGGTYSPRLVTLDLIDERPTAAASAARREEDIRAVCDAFHALGELKTAGESAGVGVRSNDWQVVKSLSDAVTFDFVTLVGGYTIMHQPPALAEFQHSLARRQIAVISAGIFHGGFLVGGSRFDRRVVNPDDLADRPLFAWRKAFASLCHGHGVRPAHACIQFALSAPGVVAVSLNTSHPDRVAENVEFVVAPVPDGLWQSMREEGLLAAI